MKALENFRDKVEKLATQEQLRDVFSVAIKAMGYHGFDAYTVKSGTIDDAEQPGNLFVCDYGLTIPRSYVRDGWLQMDPVIAEVASTSKSFDYVAFLRNSHGTLQ